VEDDDLGAEAPFGERALGLVRGYKRDLDRNRTAQCERSGRSSRGAGTSSPRCESSIS
jgi:hypothetical protein